MGRMLAPLTAAALAALAGSTAVAAKGVVDATLRGPGLESPLELTGARLLQATGLNRAAWGRLPSQPPTVGLGPRYTLTFHLGPHGDRGQIVQDVYPYAKGGAVTYTPPGQQLYAMRTRGGWYVAPSGREQPLLAILLDAGLPPEPPTQVEPASAPWSLVEWSALGGALALGGVVLVLMRRRAAPTRTS